MHDTHDGRHHRKQAFVSQLLDHSFSSPLSNVVLVPPLAKKRRNQYPELLRVTKGYLTGGISVWLPCLAIIMLGGKGVY